MRDQTEHEYLTGMEIVLIVSAVALLGAAGMAAWACMLDYMNWGA